jgi:hypothetical protein
MPEKIVHINEKVHSGQLREASWELVDRESRVTQACTERLEELTEKFPDSLTDFMVTKAIDPKKLVSPRVHQDWLKYEVSVARLLDLGPYDQLPRQLAEGLSAETVRFPESRSFAVNLINFWKTEEARVKGLEQALQKRAADSLTISRSAYANSRIIRAALYQRTYS